ncbi:MAG: hypothetical protein IJ729_02290, partial [Alloprevotella sp.]|nr:hypothetical protein [Alloprevotella sp.]
PRMEVIPLGPQRLLATSGVVSGPPVRVTLTPMGIDYYELLWGSEAIHGINPYIIYDGARWKPMSGVCIGARGWDFECSDLGSSFMSKYAASVTALRNYADSRTDCALITENQWECPLYCGPDRLATPGLTPSVTFSGGVAWTVEEFFAGARFDACSGNGSTFSGTYAGRRFEGRIMDMVFIDGGGDANNCPAPAAIPLF